MMPPLATVLSLLALAAPALAETGLPLPPSEVPKQYRAWRAKLPKAVQQKVDQHCRDHGGDYQPVCNGIGPLAIPPPPVNDGEDDDARRDWLDSLTAPQRHYVAEYCAADRTESSPARRYSTLCGGTPIVLTKLVRHGLAALVSVSPNAPVFDSLLVSAAANGDQTSSLDPSTKKRLGSLLRGERMELAEPKP